MELLIISRNYLNYGSPMYDSVNVDIQPQLKYIKKLNLTAHNIAETLPGQMSQNLLEGCSIDDNSGINQFKTKAACLLHWICQERGTQSV